MTSIKNRIQSAFRGLFGVQTPVTAVRPPEIQATFDLAQTTVHNRRHWANADSLAARASMSPAVRAIVRKRSRHEFDNNSWYSGILRTAANHIVGCGPRLQVLTTNNEANAVHVAAFVRDVEPEFRTGQSGRSEQVSGSRETVDDVGSLQSSNGG